MIHTVNFDPPEWNKREIMRYARIKGDVGDYRELIDACIAEAEPILSYRVCYTLLPVSMENEWIAFGNIITSSNTIQKAIRDAQKVLLFAATIGAPFDRLLHRYSVIEPSKALILQAMGAERVESLCDAFCKMISDELCEDGKHLTPRVSPGYGDISLSMQRDIFAILDCPRKIGLTLDESLLMSPSKSVTAICGVTDDADCVEDKCAGCDKTDCVYKQ